MFIKRDPIITYNHMYDETNRAHSTIYASKKKRIKLLLVAEVGLLLLMITCVILAMFS